MKVQKETKIIFYICLLIFIPCHLWDVDNTRGCSWSQGKGVPSIWEDVSWKDGQ